MKRFTTLLIALSIYNIAVLAQKKYEMVVEKTDGTETVFKVEDVKRTYFRERNSGSEGYITCPDGNHPHYIDLGLPSGTKWACCNVGASNPEQYGSYLTFDEAQGYNPPSLDQIKELVNNTSYQWTTQNGVNGGKFTGSNGGSVFLPAAGYRNCWDGQFYSVGSWGSHWSSTPYDEDYGYGFGFLSGDAGRGGNLYRKDGRSVRPVR